MAKLEKAGEIENWFGENWKLVGENEKLVAKSRNGLRKGEMALEMREIDVVIWYGTLGNILQPFPEIFLIFSHAWSIKRRPRRIGHYMEKGMTNNRAQAVYSSFI